jgi:L-cysteine:1D-myo-inositol 2-amino-2-deoxy-alpha-D-glucopyranoside ligase
MGALGIRPPDYFPRASDEVPEIQRIIGDLVERGFAYQRGHRVYYRVRSFPDFGRLSRLDRDEMRAVGADRGEDPNDPHKEDPLDFVLWKPSQPGEDAWPSPWGSGRPGWHIECSAMALKYLGPELDVHGGGTDLVYPHHESEIAQSVAATGHAPFARYWVHVEMVRLDGTKMSKSLGNLVLAHDLRQRVNPRAIRHYLLTVHYRDFFDYSEDALRTSVARVERLERALRQGGSTADEAALASAADRFDDALADDLDTPAALAALDDATQLVLAGSADRGARQSIALLQEMASRLGLADTPIRRVQG